MLYQPKPTNEDIQSFIIQLFNHPSFNYSDLKHCFSVVKKPNGNIKNCWENDTTHTIIGKLPTEIRKRN